MLQPLPLPSSISTAPSHEAQLPRLAAPLTSTHAALANALLLLSHPFVVHHHSGRRRWTINKLRERRFLFLPLHRTRLLGSVSVSHLDAPSRTQAASSSERLAQRGGAQNMAAALHPPHHHAPRKRTLSMPTGRHSTRSAASASAVHRCCARWHRAPRRRPTMSSTQWRAPPPRRWPGVFRPFESWAP